MLVCLNIRGSLYVIFNCISRDNFVRRLQYRIVTVRLLLQRSRTCPAGLLVLQVVCSFFVYCILRALLASLDDHTVDTSAVDSEDVELDTGS